MIVLDRDWLAECSKRTLCEKMVEKRNRPTEVEDRVHVLVAEDDEALRRLMVSVLESESYSVCSASGGREAMEIICKGGIDVALLDVKMPDISGMEVLRVAKRTDPEMEVIVMTGYADTDTAVEAVRYRAYDLIRKPFDDIRQLPTFVRRAAEKRKMARENARLTGEVQRRNRLLQEQLAELTLLYELNNGIAHVLDYERLSEHLLDTFLSLTNVEACSSLLVRQAKPILIVKAKPRMTPNALDNAKELALEAAREVAGCDLTAEATRLRYDSVHNTGEEKEYRGIAVAVERNDPVVSHHRHRLLDADTRSADRLDRDIHARTPGDLVDRSHGIVFRCIDHDIGPQRLGNLQLGGHHIHRNHQRGTGLDRALQHDVAGKAHTVDRNSIAQSDAHMDSGPRSASQGFVETPDFKRDAVRDRLYVLDVRDPGVGVRGVDQASDTVADAHLPTTYVGLRARTHRDDCPSTLVAQRPHRVGMLRPTIEPPGPQLHLMTTLGLILRTHTDTAIVVTLRTADGRLMSPDQYIVGSQIRQHHRANCDLSRLDIDDTCFDHS